MIWVQISASPLIFRDRARFMVPQSKISIAIVGSGLSSALLAKRLGEVADVTVFERGGPSPQTPIHIETGHPLGLSSSYGHGFGGTTNYWSGGLLRMRPGEMSSDWPVGMQEALADREKEAIAFLYGDEIADDFARHIPSTVNGDIFIDYILRPSEPFRASRSGYFNDVHLKLRHEVVAIREDGNKGIVGYRVGEKTGESPFDVIVLAAGNFGSPLILARSGLGGSVVGHNLTDHPMGFVAKMTASGPNRFNELAAIPYGRFGYEPMLKVKDSETGLWTSIYFRPTKTAGINSDPYADWFDVLAQTSRLRRYWKVILKFGIAGFRSQALSLAAAHGQHVYAMVVAEQESRGQGLVAEKDGVVHLDWSISDRVVGSIRRSIAVAANWAGATAITYAKGDLRDRLWSAAHHSGCCRISDDPATGVVDANLRVHGTRAIYVCDGSVLPSTGSTNSGLTISCLALRLANHVTPARSVTIPELKEHFVDILVTGASGNVGSFLLPDLKRSEFSYDVVSLRSGTTSPPTKARTLIHLANDSSSWDANSKVQRNAAAIALSALVECVIVTMTSATLQTPGKRAGDPGEFNFGFDVRFNDSYIDGKREVEQFWCDWQRDHPDRKVIFLYIPTICGPRNFWTRQIALSFPSKPMWVPSFKQFFSVTEEHLAIALLKLASSERQGVHRLFIFDRSDSLAKTIEWDRGTPDVHEFPFPHVLARACRNRLLRKCISLVHKVLDRVLHVAVGHQIVRIFHPYLTLFQEQDRAARHIHQAAESSQWESVPSRQVQTEAKRESQR